MVLVEMYVGTSVLSKPDGGGKAPDTVVWISYGTMGEREGLR